MSDDHRKLRIPAANYRAHGVTSRAGTGSINLIRLGGPNIRRQDGKGPLGERRRRLEGADGGRMRAPDHTPTRHGFWAFPTPLYDPFFTFHKFQEVLPKHLRDDAFTRMEDDGADTPTMHGLYRERDEWINTHGPAAMRLTEFTWRGAIYTHMLRNGDALPMGEWRLVDADEMFTIARRHIPKWRTKRYSMDSWEVFCPRHSSHPRG